jgi:hypothetical protein
MLAVVGWYGADVSGVRVAATVKFDSYGRLEQNPGRKSTKK